MNNTILVLLLYGFEENLILCLIEFIMINDDCKQITCQVKNKNTINLDDYRDDKNIYEKIYIFSAEGVSGTPSKNIEVISRENLYTFLKDDCSCSFFRKRLEKWYTFE